MQILKPSTSETKELSEFFQKEIDVLWHLYNYPENDIADWKDWHSYHSLIEKIIDPNRFFSIIRNENNKIIGVFESKKSSQEENVEVIQWTLINEKHTWQWIGSMFRYDFLLYCRENNVKKIKTFCHKENISSQNLSKKFGFKLVGSDNDIFIFEKIL